ncbi:MAG TPA: heterodisulfide reductase-related iron-sulfur binding cluster, partial [Candidatus Aminicenantes bacterium]|nr:heterodisulfide reductase-related iron-sulfur binding cluster [Candidatus Aminicenantes bacterium]
PFAHKVACYYGCMMVRPHKILGFDRPEDPESMDELMKKIGANPLDWAFKVECCGAGFSVSRTDLVAKLSGRILDDAVTRGAEALVVACPMCQSNLDMRRKAIDKYLGRETGIPVIYVTQAIGLALGIDERKLGLQRHFVPVRFAEAGSAAEV